MNVMGDDDTIPASIFPYVYKVNIIGCCGVGKTTLLWRYLHNEFKDLRGTIVDKENKKVSVNGRSIELEIWDTARQETYDSMPEMDLRNTNAVIIVYQITDPASYVEVKDSSWLRMVYGLFGEDADQHIPILLVGSKSDLVDKYDDLQVRVRSRDVKEDLKHRHSQLLGPIECSSKTGKNVDKVFQVLAEEIVRRDMEGSLSIHKSGHPKVVRTDTQGPCTC